MLQALLRKKIRSAEHCDGLARQEDVVTSLAFGMLELLPHDRGIGAWLTALKLPASESAKLDFWPTVDPKTEPDVLVKTPQYSALVEAKVAADFGARQLGREWDWLHSQCEAPFYLIVITRIPRTVAAIQERCIGDLQALGSKHDPPTLDQIRTTTWSDLAKVVRGLPEEHPAHLARLRESLLAGLKMAGVMHPPFKGWPRTPLLLNANSEWYDAWPRTPLLLNANSEWYDAGRPQ